MENRGTVDEMYIPLLELTGGYTRYCALAEVRHFMCGLTHCVDYPSYSPRPAIHVGTLKNHYTDGV